MDDLYEEMLYRYMSEVQPALVKQISIYASAIVERRCYQALRDIQKAIQDYDKSDEECFMVIEDILSTLEQYGVPCGGRHDF